MTMADNTIHDLLDEVNCADSCEAVTALCALIIPGLFEPPVRTLRATIPENESHIFR